MDWDKHAGLVVHSAAVRPGEAVSLLGPPPAEPLLLALFRAVLRVGAHPLLLLRPEACDAILCAEANDAQLRRPDPLAACEVEAARVAIHVQLAPARPLDRAADRLALLQQARRPLVERFLARAARGDVRWLATVFPIGDADYAEHVSRAMFLDHADPAAAWRAQGERQARLIDRLRPVRTLHIVGPTGTDLRLGVAGRPWTNGAGQRNLPDGEVFVTPHPEATEGVAIFDVPTVLAGRQVRGARLTFRAGRVVAAVADAGADVLHGMLTEPGGAVVGEFALGCNSAVTAPLGHPLLDEKRAGTFHLALGAPDSPLHCDLIGTLGRVEADGVVVQTAMASGRR